MWVCEWKTALGTLLKRGLCSWNRYMCSICLRGLHKWKHLYVFAGASLCCLCSVITLIRTRQRQVSLTLNFNTIVTRTKGFMLELKSINVDQWVSLKSLRHFGPIRSVRVCAAVAHSCISGKGCTSGYTLMSWQWCRVQSYSVTAAVLLNCAALLSFCLTHIVHWAYHSSAACVFTWHQISSN